MLRAECSANRRSKALKAIKWLDERFEETLLVILLVLISCVELVQVIIRNVPFIPALTWAEEFCRFCWIWSVFLSLPYTIKKASMLRVSVVVDALPNKVRSIFNIIVNLVVAATMFYLGVNSVAVVRAIQLSNETSPAMLWPMWAIYAIMLVGFFLGGVRGIQQTYVSIRDYTKKKLSTTEQTMAEAAEEAESGKRAEGR